jgi:hypothetical protein
VIGRAARLIALATRQPGSYQHGKRICHACPNPTGTLSAAKKMIASLFRRNPRWLAAFALSNFPFRISAFNFLCQPSVAPKKAAFIRDCLWHDSPR